MIRSLIVAIDRNGAMGKDNKLPWHLPADLRFFKRTTLGKPVIMGRRTWESLGRALPGRLNIVLSSGAPVLPEGVLLCRDIAGALARVAEEAAEEAFIIGGSNVFREALPQLQRMYITEIATTVDRADTFFPEVDYSKWRLTREEAHGADEHNKYDYVFRQWDRAAE